MPFSSTGVLGVIERTASQVPPRVQVKHTAPLALVQRAAWQRPPHSIGVSL